MVAVSDSEERHTGRLTQDVAHHLPSAVVQDTTMAREVECGIITIGTIVDVK